MTQPRPTRRRPARPEGQWARGFREPLNSTERFKRDNDGLAVRRRVLDIYSKRPTGTVPLVRPLHPTAAGNRRRPHCDAGSRRARGRALHAAGPHPGRPAHDRPIAHDRRPTNRQNIQLHWVRIEDVPAIWEGLESVGLSTTEACGDTPNNMLGYPLTGVAADEVLDASAALASLGQFVGDSRFSNLPRKCKTAISGCAQHCTLHEINDLAFVGVHGLDGTGRQDLMR